MNIKYKVVAASMLAAFVFPVVASAQSMTTAQLQAEIQTLTAQLQSLQQSAVAQGGSGTSGSVLGAQCSNFTQPMGQGSSGIEVTMLQKDLNGDGFSVNVTGVFDAQTVAAVDQFQEEYANIVLTPSGLTSPTGYVGTSTLSLLNALYGCNIAAVTKGKLIVTRNWSVTKQTLVPGVTNQLVGSFNLRATSAEGVSVGIMTITPGVNYFQNLKVYINGVQFGTTQGTVSSGATYEFTGGSQEPTVPAGTTIPVNLYADILSSASGTTQGATTLNGCDGSGLKAYDPITCSNTPVQGQTIAISATGPSVTVGVDSSNPPAGQLVQGSTGDTLAAYRFSETSNVENLKILQLNVVDRVTNTTSVLAAFNPLTLWNGSTLLGTSASPVLDAARTGYLYVFNNLTNFVVPRGGSASITLKGNAGIFSNGSITDNSVSTFDIATTTDAVNNKPALTVVALGLTSNRPATVTLSNANGNPQTILRSVLTATGASVTTLPPANFQPLGTLTLTANSAGDVQMNSLRILTNISTSTFLKTLALKDSNYNDIVTVFGYATTTINPAGSVTWTFATSTHPLIFPAGSSYTLTLFGDLSKIPAIPNAAITLTAQLYYPSDLSYYDATNNYPALVTLPQTAVPLTISSLVSPVGGQL